MNLLGLFFSFIILLMFLCSVNIERNIFNPVSIFTFLFFLIFMLPSLNLYGWVPVDDRIYLICFIGVLCFVVGGFAAKSVAFKKGNSTYTLPMQKHSIELRSRPMNVRTYLYYLILVAVISYQIIYSMRVIRMLSRGFGLGAIRYAASLDYALENGFNQLTPSRLDSIINRRIIKPCVNFLIPLLIVRSFDETGRINKKNLVLMIVLSGLETFRTGGRITLVICVMQFFTYFLFLRKTIHLSKKMKRRILRVIVILGISIVFFTFMRKGASSLSFIFKEFYVYYGGALPNFSLRCEELFRAPRTLGFALLNPFFEILIRIFKTVFGMKEPELFIQATSIISTLQTKVQVSKDQTFNAFVTLFYYFYSDFGIIGVIILSFAYGFFCGYIYKKMKQKRDILYSVLYLWLVNGIIYSMVRWQFYSSSYAYVVFVGVILFTRKRQISFVWTKSPRADKMMETKSHLSQGKVSS